MSNDFFLEPKIKHIAFIMDGNRRWAVNNGLHKLMGHKFGVEALKRVLKLQQKYGIKIMTFYALSKDNVKKRGIDEYNSLMNLFVNQFEKLKDEFKNATAKVKISVFGDYKKLREDVVSKISEIIEETKNNDDFYINFCINYDGQDEIVYGIKNLFKDIEIGKIRKDDVDEKVFKNYIYTSDFPPPEIIVRAGNLPRLSGFLLWDSMYSEIYFCEKMWPDFDEKELLKIFNWFKNINRKFGK